MGLELNHITKEHGFLWTPSCRWDTPYAVRVEWLYHSEYDFFFFSPVANKEAGPGAGVADHGHRPVGAELGLHRGHLTPYPGSSLEPSYLRVLSSNSTEKEV